ncbi:PAS domain-containing sensor histidine kinase [Pedosphaera parvula]|uniref:histidine kinase n=1 Tax=Pedosphaera parvula (strain Ellin514) TaxID=320771 RepID=B9XR01_PEDPL|nr:PAS domain-containing sensor histidine kinase [Pedosphaera parvula]EEF57697.1 PAS/PAC sensor signal transduction histidine kinase [Pedosphaera parvula Ellin514]
MRENDEQSRALLAAIVDSSEDAIITKNLDGIITSWNQGAEGIFGYTPQEAIGQPVTMLIPPDRMEEEPVILERIKRGERIKHYQTVRRAKNGALLNISLTVSPLINSEGRIIGASKIARDISHEVNTQERVRQSEEQFRVTLSSIGDAVIATDRNGRITFMNSVAETLTGWDTPQAIGIPLDNAFKIVNEFTRQPAENPVNKVIQEGKVVGLANHTILISKDGTERPIDDSGAPIRGSAADLRGVVLVFRDVTERREAEVAALRLAAIVQNSDDAIISKNLDGIITSWNEGAQRIFGYSANEIIGKSIKTLVPPELQEQEDEILGRLRRGERVFHFETIRVAKEGRHIPISLTISPIKDPSGHIIGASKIARDITERKQAEKALAEAKEKLQSYANELELQVRERTRSLEKTITELESFSYSLSHDMRAPLRAIESFSEIVLKDYGETIGAPGVDLLKRTITAAHRMDKLILDLLTLTRLSQAPINLEPIDLEKLIDGIIQGRLEFQPPQAEIKIQKPLFRVTGNEVSLTQCLTNLLDNAVKFVPTGTVPHVRIHSEPNGDGVRLWIEDNGIGINANEKKQLFQMFQRIHSDTYPGTGIGLAIVRKAVERMGGEAGVESEPGKGSQFWLQLQRDGA